MWKRVAEKEGVNGDEYLLDAGCGTGSVAISWAKILKKGKWLA
jgi:precorrin-6B methylase 2